jgi:hypothetical protein
VSVNWRNWRKRGSTEAVFETGAEKGVETANNGPFTFAVRTTDRSPQALIEVRFKTAEEGGRRSAIYRTPLKNFYSCPMGLDGEYFACRLYLEDEVKLEPGGTYCLQVRFLNPALVLPRLRSGKEITLWEGKPVAEGKVLRVSA